MSGPRTLPEHLALGRQALHEGDPRRAAVHFHEALELDPDHGAAREQLAAALYAYAHALRGGAAFEAAAAAFAQATNFAPENADGWFALGNACMEVEMQRVDAARAGTAPQPGEDYLAHAVAAFARAAALEPASPRIAANRAMAARYACAWPEARAALDVLRDLSHDTAFACEPMCAVALLDDAHAQRRGIENWARENVAGGAAPVVPKRRGERLRVGYLSTDFHDHATAHLAAGLFERHDQARFEVFAYAADEDDGSAMRGRLRAAFEHWRDVREVSDADAARLIAQDRLDVLVELKGHTRGTRLPILGHRPAPAQLHYLGFPGTIGYAGVDAIVADAVVAPPDSDGEFAERVLRLPVCYQANDDRRVLPPAVSRAAAGLPERGLVLACFNQAYKLAQPFVQAWLDALREHDDAVLWLTVPHALARRNLAALAQASGIAPQRLIFAPTLPQEAHIARLRCADLALDVLPYGSHTTGSDALFAGVPLLTARGTTFAGRVGASLCAVAGLSDLVAESFGDYTATLAKLCADRARLAHYKRDLESERARLPLFDTEGFTRAFERMLESVA